MPVTPRLNPCLAGHLARQPVVPYSILSGLYVSQGWDGVSLYSLTAQWDCRVHPTPGFITSICFL